MNFGEGEKVEINGKIKTKPIIGYTSCESITISKFVFDDIFLEDSEEEFIEKESNTSRLDLAFLFSSPLVTAYRNKDGLKLKPVASLEYENEFDLVMKNISESGLNIKYTKSVATVNTFQKCLNDMPIALHFAGHGITNKAFDRERSQEGDFLVFEDEKEKHITFPAKSSRKFWLLAQNNQSLF